MLYPPCDLFADTTNTSNAVPFLAETLRRARDLLLEKGWTQGTFDNTHGYCTLGACHYSFPQETPTSLRDATCSTMRNVLFTTIQATYGAEHPAESMSVIIWNDTPGRTKDEVLAVFDQAIANVCEAEILNG